MYDERTLDQLRDALPAVVAKIAEPDPRAGRNMYKCPLCRSGNEPGRNHDGAFSVYGSGRRCWLNGGECKITTHREFAESEKPFCCHLRCPHIGDGTSCDECRKEYMEEKR